MKKQCLALLLGAFLIYGCEKPERNVEPEEIPEEKTDETPEPSLGVVKYNNEWYQKGDTIFGFKDYVYLVVGDSDSPLLLGAPHDGIATGTPVMPETGTTGRDINTLTFSNAISTLFEADTQKKPWLMVNTISRKIVDPNSYPNEAPTRYTNADAMATYLSYHELLNLARVTLSANHQGGKGGLFLDVHGHAHKYANGHQETYPSILSGNPILSNFICQTDVGYALSNYSLEQSDTYLNNLADSSSVAYLAYAHPSVDFSQIIRGSKSFGGLLSAENVTAVPSTDMPVLDRSSLLFGVSAGQAARRPYFNGGYITRKYGTVKIGSTIGFNDNFVSIQIETPGINVRNNSTIIARSSHQFKRAIIEYLNHWFGYSYANSAYPF